MKIAGASIAFPIRRRPPPVCLRGTVIDSAKRHFGAGRGFYEAIVMDGSGGVFGSGKITCRWFNMPFIHKLVATGQEVVVYGKVKDANGRLIIDHPEFEVLREDEEEVDSIHLERIVPIYRNIAGLAQRRLREIMHLLLLQSDPATLAGYLRRGSWHRRGRRRCGRRISLNPSSRRMPPGAASRWKSFSASS